MTFSIVGYCQKTGMTGVAITTSSICVASRCPWVRAEVGAVATQNVTDPSLGNRLLEYIEQGMSPQAGIDKLIRESRFTEYRQLLAIDTHGQIGHFTGEKILGVNAISEGVNCVAAGNLLDNAGVPEAMTGHFGETEQLHLAERLLTALQAGVSAGGEAGPTHSAGLKIAHHHNWPLVDLRVDWSEVNPVDALYEIWKLYEPQVDDYTNRAINPVVAPSYGVKGDP